MIWYRSFFDLILFRIGYATGSVEGRIAVEYFDPSPDVQKEKYAFKCHRQTVDGIDHVWPVNTIAFHPMYVLPFLSLLPTFKIESFSFPPFYLSPAPIINQLQHLRLRRVRRHGLPLGPPLQKTSAPTPQIPRRSQLCLFLLRRCEIGFGGELWMG